MTFKFKKNISLSYVQTAEFLGQETHAHRIKKVITIKTLKGGAFDENNVATNLTTATNADIFIEDTFIGKGNVSIATDLNVENFQGREFVTATVTQYNEGFAGYLGIDDSILKDIQNLEENFQTNTTENGEITTTHTVSIVPQPGKDLFTVVKDFASELRKDYGSHFSIFQENFNLLTGTYSFTETSQSGSGVYFSKIKNSVTIGEDGVTNVSEEGEIQGLNEPVGDSAETGLAAQLALSYGRCADLCESAFPLHTQFTSRQVVRNSFTGAYTYSISFSNDPHIQLSYVWDYTLNIETNDEQISTATENGTVRGFGCSRNEKYVNAVDAYESIKSGIQGRLSPYVDDLMPSPLEDSVSKSLFQGSVSYSVKYTNDPNWAANNQFLKIETVIEKKIPVRIKNRWACLGAGVVVQDEESLSIGQLTISINIQGKRDSGGLNVYFLMAENIAKSQASGCYISGAQHSYNPQEFTYSTSITYDFFETADVGGDTFDGDSPDGQSNNYTNTSTSWSGFDDDNGLSIKGSEDAPPIGHSISNGGNDMKYPPRGIPGKPDGSIDKDFRKRMEEQFPNGKWYSKDGKSYFDAHYYEEINGFKWRTHKDNKDWNWSPFFW